MDFVGVVVYGYLMKIYEFDHGALRLRVECHIRMPGGGVWVPIDEPANEIMERMRALVESGDHEYTSSDGVRYRLRAGWVK